jgi:eukaryotic-like serine/threonine-protein kinase
MAPEQARGRNPTRSIERSDVFGLGGILYKILTGRSPYSGEDSAIVQRARAGEVLPPQQVAPGLAHSPALCTIAMRALSRSREDRYPSVESLRADVERAMREGLSLDRKVFPAGTLILREGESPDAAYIVVQGRCEAFRTGPAGRTSLRTMGPGDVFGEMALLSARPRSASVVALDEVVAMVITPAALAREVHAESWLARLLATLVERFRDLEGREP